MQPYIPIYLLVINTLALTLMGIDKSRARRRAWRIPEKALFLSAAAGGSVGAIAGMFAFRHKTKHLRFVLGLPLILLLQLTAALLLTRSFPA